MTVASPQKSSSISNSSSSKKKKKKRGRRAQAAYSTISRDDSFDSYNSHDLEERFGLVAPLSIEPSSEIQGYDYRDEDEYDEIMWTSPRRWGSFCYLGLFMVAVLIVAMIVLAIPDSSSSTATHSGGKNTTTQYNVKGKPVYFHPGSSKYSSVPVDYECLKDLAEDQTKNVTMDEGDIVYLIDNNLTEYLDYYRESTFGLDGNTYEATKAAMHDFKSQYFVDNLKSENAIYQADCGVGLDLLMTLEVIKEKSDKITNLYAYGSTFFNQSSTRANVLVDHFVDEKFMTKGKICPGRPLHLGFVPSSSFDLAYTAHITPLDDPLETGLRKDKYISACGNSSDWHSETIAQVAQNKQEDYFEAYVSELVRIVKAGAPVIVERVTKPFCEVPADNGGVSREWWEDNVTNSTSWDVDPESLAFQNDTQSADRYHVFMRKNKNS